MHDVDLIRLRLMIEYIDIDAIFDGTYSVQGAPEEHRTIRANGVALHKANRSMALTSDHFPPST
ncbi:hypothetical protein C6361_30505 [Plantactinospora sp. BC1]|nr:hypothetical protein C6361_30505 [Plantactinospora sp. BC1]